VRIQKRLLFAVAGLCGAIAAPACQGDPAQPAATPPARITSPVKEAELTSLTLTAEAAQRLGIETAVVERKGIARTRTVGGEVMAPPGAGVTVSAPVAGTLDASLPAPTAGTSVARGRAIFRLVPLAPAERDARVDAERAVSEAAARVDVVSKRAQRAELLARDGAGSRRAAEEAQGEFAIANADLKAAKDRLALASRGNATSAGIELDAPYAGLVRNVYVSRGQAVASGEPLFDIVRLDTVWVRVPLFVGEADDVDPNAPARVVGLGEAAESEGIVAKPVSAPPSADPSTAAVDLYFSLQNRGELLRPGQRVGVKLTTKGAAARLVVPRAAVLHDAYGGTWVYEVKEPHVYVRRRVSVIDLTDGEAVLDQGPAPGTTVVTAGAAELFGTEFGVGK
jgi:RND family efflux transporter MFP subunit